MTKCIKVIVEATATQRKRNKSALAAEGYRFYAQEASEFAAASLQAVSEVLGHGGQRGGRDRLEMVEMTELQVAETGVLNDI